MSEDGSGSGGGRIDRRQFVKAGASSVALVTFAGCSGSESTDTPADGGDGSGDDGGDTSSPADGGATTGTPTLESFSFRLANSVPETGIFSKYGKRFINNVEEASDGKITGELFPNGQLGTVVEMANSAKTGSIDMVIIPMSPIFRDFSVFAYPYVFEDYDHLLRGTNPETSPVMQDLLERMGSEANVRLLGMSILGTRQVSLNETKACTPSDLNGLDIRSPPLEIFTKTVEGLGGNPVNLDPTELVSSLSSGAVQGQENPVNVMNSFGLQEVQEYVIETEHIRHAVPHYTNLDFWDGMSSEAQTIVQDAANEASQWNAEAIASAEEEATQALKDGGMTFVGTDDCLDLDAFKESTRSLVSEAFPEWAELASQLQQV